MHRIYYKLTYNTVKEPCYVTHLSGLNYAELVCVDFLILLVMCECFTRFWSDSLCPRNFLKQKLQCVIIDPCYFWNRVRTFILFLGSLFLSAELCSATV